MDFCRKTILLLIFSSFMSVGWGQSEMDNYSHEIINISDEKVMIISNHEMEGYTFSDTTYISVSRLLPPCNDGYTEIDGECYYQSDLDVLQIFIDNSDSTINMDMDVDSSGVIEPLELGEQEWVDGRITYWSFNFYGLSALSGEIPPEIGNLTNLTDLKLYYNQFTGEIPSEIGSLINLTDLTLWYSGLSGEIPSEIGNLTNLTALCLTGNQLIGEIPAEIGFTSLTHIEISNNQLNGEIPSEICDLINLDYLSLFNNNFNGELPDHFFDLINITWLRLSNNNFTGEIGNLTELVMLERVSLNGNQFFGEIPENIGNLSNLESLLLWNNLFTGNIPSSIGSLTNLTNLQLQNNQLSGTIPVSICNLSQLDWSSTYVGGGEEYIYNNNLCPPYPDCLVNQEPFTDENNNCIWDAGEPFEDTNENGIYEPDYIGNQDTSECIYPGDQCQVGDEYGYYDCYETCLLSIYFEEWLGDGFCDDSGISFNCADFGYDCGDCSEECDGTDPLGFCSCPLVTGDTNEDGLLNVLDIMLVVNCVLTDDCDDCSDLNYDGNVDVLDIMIMVNLVLEN